MGWMPPERIAAFQEERRVQKQWQQRNVSQGRRGAKENRMQIEKRVLHPQALRLADEWIQLAQRDTPGSLREEDITMDNKLFPGVAVVYRSQFRYSEAHEDMLTIDMFDATIPAVKEVKTVAGGSMPVMEHGARPFETRTLMPDEVPHALQGKLATLEIVRGSLCTTPTMRAHVPGVGVVFGTGVKWVILTKEDCDGG